MDAMEQLAQMSPDYIKKTLGLPSNVGPWPVVQPSENKEEALAGNSQNADVPQSNADVPQGNNSFATLPNNGAMPPGYPQMGLDPKLLKQFQDQIAQQQKGISQTEDYQKAIRGIPVQTDLSPMMALADYLSGSKLAASYQKPQSGEDKIKSLSDLQNSTQKQRESITGQIEKLLAARTNSDYIKTLSAKDRNDRFTLNRATSFDRALDPNGPGNGVFQSYGKTINSADRALQLIKQYPDLNIPKAQQREFSTAIAGLILSSGSGGRLPLEQINELVPSSMAGDAKDLESRIFNKPVGRNQQAFVQAMVDTANRERGLAQSSLLKNQFQRIGPYEDLAVSAPQHFENVLKRRTGMSLDQYSKYKNNPQGDQAQSAPTQELVPRKVPREKRLGLFDSKTKQFVKWQ